MEGEVEVGSRRSWLMIVLTISQGLLSEEDKYIILCNHVFYCCI